MKTRAKIAGVAENNGEKVRVNVVHPGDILKMNFMSTGVSYACSLMFSVGRFVFGEAPKLVSCFLRHKRN